MTKDGYRGTRIYYPSGTSTVQQPDGSIKQIPNQEIAMQIVETIRTGGVFALPSEVDANGTPRWKVEESQVSNNPSHILQYPKELDAEILNAMGIADDVLKSEATGSWAGKAVPQQATYCILEQWLSDLICDVDRVIERLVEINFGPGHQYEITTRPLADQMLAQQNGESSSTTAQDAPGSARSPGARMRMGLADSDWLRMSWNPNQPRAPIGGVRINGTFYPGGQFIPLEDFNRASAGERADFDEKWRAQDTPAYGEEGGPIGPPTPEQSAANKEKPKFVKGGRIEGYDETFDHFTQEELDHLNELAKQAWGMRNNHPDMRGDEAARSLDAFLGQALGRKPNRKAGWEWPYQKEAMSGSEADGDSAGITVSKQQDLVASDLLIGELLESGAAETFQVKATRTVAWGTLPWSHITTEYVRVVTEEGIFIFEGSTDVAYSATDLSEIEHKPYTLVAAYPANLGPAVAVDYFKAFHTVDNDLARARSIENELTFALHLLPTGAMIDQAREGQYGEATISGISDSLLLAGSLAKAVRAAAASRKIALTSQQLATLSTIERRVAMAEGAFDLAVGGYRAGQSYHNLTNEDGSTAEGAGQAAEALLRVFSGTLATRNLAKKGRSPTSTAANKPTGSQSTKAGALDVNYVAGTNQQALTFHHGPLESSDPRLQRVNDVLGKLKKTIGSEYAALSKRAARGDKQAIAIVQRINNECCTEIAEIFDDLFRKNQMPPSLTAMRKGSRNAEDLAKSRGSEHILLDVPKSKVQHTIVQQMLERGDGATAIILYGRKHSPGHSINVVNIDGDIFFNDAITGRCVPASGKANMNAFLDAFDGDDAGRIPNNGQIWLIPTK